jgi:membrane protein implicated in regulation of membrane protease activity
MRRIDVIGIGIGIFAIGGIAYLVLRQVGLDDINAGIWSQVLLVSGLLVWLLTYLARAFTQNMTLNQQLKDYEDAVLQKRLEELTPEQLEKLQAEVELEKQKAKGED